MIHSFVFARHYFFVLLLYDRTDYNVENEGSHKHADPREEADSKSVEKHRERKGEDNWNLQDAGKVEAEVEELLSVNLDEVGDLSLAELLVGGG